MSILKKRNILKLAAILMLVPMMAGAFAGHTKAAFAVNPSCNIGTFIQGPCDMSVAATFNGAIAFSNTALVTVASAVLGPNSFTFNTEVQDQRTTSGGWTLQATSLGVSSDGGSTYIPVSIGGNATPTPVCTTTGLTCPIVTGLASLTDITTGTPTFATASSTDSPHGGTVTVTTPGSFTIVSTAPGDYTGTITISLVATAP